MTEQTEKDVKKNNTSHPTNEHDVQIAQINSEVEKLQFELGAKLLAENKAKQGKNQLVEKITASTERVLIGGMVLAGVIYTTGKRYDVMNHIVEGDE